MIIYIVSSRHPWKKIKKVDAQVINPGKFTWAVYKGHRYMLGATAFYTLSSATCSRVGYLTRIVNCKYLNALQPDLYRKAKEILRGIKTKRLSV